MDPNSVKLPPVQLPDQNGGSNNGFSSSQDSKSRQRQTAVDIARSQLDSVFSGASPLDTRVKQVVAPRATRPVAASPQAVTVSGTTPIVNPSANNVQDTNRDSPTQRTQPAVSAADWKRYHSAWQSYYQHYYEGYYTQQLSSARQKIVAQAQTQPAAIQPANVIKPAQGGNQTENNTPDRNQAVQELKGALLKKVEQSAKQARRSRHFVPISAALAVVLIFGFLQYNEIIVANVRAYVTPGMIDPQNIIIDPKELTAVGPESRLIIPKINVDTPVAYDIPTDEASQNKAMQNGVAHFAIPGANSHPGEIGNTVISGHSSNDVFAPGDYKYVFMQLDKLKKGDSIYANYKGKRYTYVITKIKEVAPSDVSALIYKTNKPELTLITCTPLGTATRRLLVTAEQIYPETAKPAPKPAEKSDSSAPASIPGTDSQSIFQRLFGG